MARLKILSEFGIECCTYVYTYVVPMCTYVVPMCTPMLYLCVHLCCTYVHAPVVTMCTYVYMKQTKSIYFKSFSTWGVIDFFLLLIFFSFLPISGILSLSLYHISHSCASVTRWFYQFWQFYNSENVPNTIDKFWQSRFKILLNTTT